MTWAMEIRISVLRFVLRTFSTRQSALMIFSVSCSTQSRASVLQLEGWRLGVCVCECSTYQLSEKDSRCFMNGCYIDHVPQLPTPTTSMYARTTRPGRSACSQFPLMLVLVNVNYRCPLGVLFAIASRVNHTD